VMIKEIVLMVVKCDDNFLILYPDWG